jgi:hypothetical protein
MNIDLQLGQVKLVNMQNNQVQCFHITIRMVFLVFMRGFINSRHGKNFYNFWAIQGCKNFMGNSWHIQVVKRVK